MTTLIQNRPPMSDEQRRAMFARMRGGGSHSGGSSSGGSWTQNADGTLSFPNDMSWVDREAKGISGAESDFLIAGLPGAGGLMSTLGRAGKALASWKTPILSALGASGLDSYRENHPTLDPKTDHYLALGQQVAGCIESKIEPVGPWRDAGDGREAANKPARAHTAAQCQGLHAGFIFGVAVQML